MILCRRLLVETIEKDGTRRLQLKCNFVILWPIRLASKARDFFHKQIILRLI